MAHPDNDRNGSSHDGDRLVLLLPLACMFSPRLSWSVLGMIDASQVFENQCLPLGGATVGLSGFPEDPCMTSALSFRMSDSAGTTNPILCFPCDWMLTCGLSSPSANVRHCFAGPNRFLRRKQGLEFVPK